MLIKRKNNAIHRIIIKESFHPEVATGKNQKEDWRENKLPTQKRDFLEEAIVSNT